MAKTEYKTLEISEAELNTLSNALIALAEKYKQYGYVQQGDLGQLIRLQEALAKRSFYPKIANERTQEIRELVKDVKEDNGN